jgi:hypothetical protein
VKTTIQLILANPPKGVSIIHCTRTFETICSRFVMTSATPSPVPVVRVTNKTVSRLDQISNSKMPDPSPAATYPTQRPQHQKPPKPKFRFRVDDLRHPAATAFMKLLPDVEQALETALSNIVKSLYTSPPTASVTKTTEPKRQVIKLPVTKSEIVTENAKRDKNRPSFTPYIPATRSVTLILRDFGGVAYTTGTELDDDHKEIHFSLPYIGSTVTDNSDPISELKGVLTHELVHCYQHTMPPEEDDEPSLQLLSTKTEKEEFHSDGSDVQQHLQQATATMAVRYPPGGLIEGIADFVRLKAGLVPGHWKRPSSAEDRPGKWDEGYEHTAFFLAWLEDVYIGEGAIGMLNDRLFRTGYIDESDISEKQQEKEGKEESQEKPDATGDNNIESTTKLIPGFWKGLFGESVDELWAKYGEYLDSLREPTIMGKPPPPC